MTNSPAVQVEGLRKQFMVGMGVRKRLGLDGMSFTVQAGEIYGFLGPNGAGKTTSIKVLTSLLRPDKGEALLFGAPPWSPASRKRIGFLPESPVFYDHLTGQELLSFCGTLCGMSRASIKARSKELLESVGLAHAANLQIRRYSKGMTQRLGIAQALLHDPELVILDEPMSGLDPMGRSDVRDIILELSKEGKTIFFSTHIIPDVEAICTRVGIVNRGKMLREGTVAELLSEGSTGISEVVVHGVPEGFRREQAHLDPPLLDGRVAFETPTASTGAFLQAVLAAGGTVVSVTPKQASLEDLVVRLIDRGED